jgi:hypothetical protein
MLTVHVRVNDAPTGKPTPVRIRFVAQGRYLVPFGRLTEFATAVGEDVGGHLLLGAEPFAYIDGACEVRLPPGPVLIEVSKGPEYTPLRREVSLGLGQVSLRVAVDRWIDLRQGGWYAGDTRCHYLPPHAALLEGAAEDLAVVNLLAQERPPAADRPPAVPNLLAFSGKQPALETPACLVVVNTLNTHPLLGSVGLLNSHRAVYPLSFGPPGLDNWSVADWCDQCHRKSGLVVWADLPRLTEAHPQGEALAALILGKVDAFEVCRFDSIEPAVLGDWYRLLDCGFRVPLAGGSGKDSNAIALGSVRTYARLEPGQEFGYAAWIEAVRAGRTFVTNGPLLSLTAEGRGPGTVLAKSPGQMIPVRVEAQGMVPFDQVEVLLNGHVVLSKEASGNRLAARIEAELPVASGWLVARCWSRDRLPGGEGQCVYAHTSPVYLVVDQQPLRPERATVAPLAAVLDRTLAWSAREARYENDHQREHLESILTEARQELLRRVSANRL